MLHPLISDFAIRHRITLPDPQCDHLTVIVDETYRVRLQSAPDGTVVISSRLTHLPPAGYGRDCLMQALGKLAAGMLTESSAACVIDNRETSFWLQQVVTRESIVSIDDAFGNYINDLSFWTRAIKRLL